MIVIALVDRKVDAITIEEIEGLILFMLPNLHLFLLHKFLTNNSYTTILPKIISFGVLIFMGLDEVAEDMFVAVEKAVLVVVLCSVKFALDMVTVPYARIS